MPHGDNAQHPPPRQPTVTVAAPPGSFTDAARRHFDTLHPAALEHRAALGLPTDRPIVMTGHQPVFFHPGILAKYAAADAIAAAIGARAAALVVDHDAVDPFTVQAPAADADGLPTPIAVTLAEPVPPRTVCHAARARDDREKHEKTLEKSPLDNETRARCTAAVRAIAANTHRANAALQAYHANADLLRAHAEVLTAHPPITVSDLADTPLFAEAVARLRAHTETRSAYSDAARAHPDAGIAPLADRELPLWRITPKGARMTAMLNDTDPADAPVLRPKALLLTALARTALCDLFIHGTGGGIYDRVTDDWLRACAPVPGELAEAARSGAPTGVVTADAHLPSEPAERIEPRDVTHAAWRAHHARHHPGEINDDAHQHTRDELAHQIRLSRPGRARDRAFRELHAFLESYRETRAHEIGQLDRRAAGLARIAAWQRTNAGRSWPAFFYPERTLADLAARVGDSVLKGGRVAASADTETT